VTEAPTRVTGFRYEPGNLVVVAGSEVAVSPAEPPKAAVHADPPLPDGLALDPSSGTVTGRTKATAPGTLHTLRTADGTAVGALYIEVVARPGRPGDRFVAPTGDDTAAGDEAHPYRSIGRALEGAAPGTTVFVRAGRYHESVRITGLHGAAGRPIVLRGYPGEKPIIDASIAEPLTWTRARGRGAAPDEWVADVGGNGLNKDEVASRGAFVERTPYTRLLTYARLEDLRAENQLWITDGSRPGPTTTRGDRKPWTYFGPGIWFDAETSRVHLRLSPTHHGAAGYAEYTGPRDPAAAKVSVTRRGRRALTVENSSFVEVRDLVLAHGGDETARLENVADVVLDHVDIRAATIGLMVASTTRTRILHTRIDGGVPPWTFRSDYKDDYKYESPTEGTVDNGLIGKTQRSLLYVSGGNRQLEVGYCELENGHDVYVAGIDSEIHHCVIRNLQDEALFVSHTPDVADLRIHDNLITQVLAVVSGAGNKESGARYIYRNVFDLRSPTAGYRPDGRGRDPRRWGQPFKGNVAAAPLYFYQNTILVRPSGQAALLHFRQLERDGVVLHPRWFLNNLIVAELTGPDDDRSLSFVPDSQYLEQRGPDGQPLLRSDGNVWVRPSWAKAPLFRCLTLVDGKRCAENGYARATDLPAGFEAQSRVVTAPPAATQAGARSALALTAKAGVAVEAAPTAGVALPAALPGSDAPARQAGAGDALRIGVDARVGY
jgi:hypothetical protein